MRSLLRLTLGLVVLSFMLGVGAQSASAAFTWKGEWNMPWMQEMIIVDGSDTLFSYTNVTSAGTQYENTYSIRANRTSTTPLVFKGLVTDSGYPDQPESGFVAPIEMKVSDDGKSFTGTVAYPFSGGTPEKISGTCTRGNCMMNTGAEQELPSPLVTLASVANGCGPGTAGTAPRYFDTTTYSDPGTEQEYTVSFRQACDMHDAAYNGARVRDPFNADKIIDYYPWRQMAIDTQFLRNMRTLCTDQIPAAATTARRQCANNGATFSTGALTRYKAVRAVGHRSYVKRPDLAGRWIARDGRGRPKPFWQFRQKNRLVLVSWKKPGNEGSFRGIIISRDGKSLISGFTTSKVNGVSKTGASRFVFVPEQPKRMRVTGLLGGLVLTR